MRASSHVECGVQDPYSLCSAQCETRPPPLPPGRPWPGILDTKAEPGEARWAAFTWMDEWVGRDGGEGPQLPGACPAHGPRLGCPPRPRSTWVPSGWVQRGRPVSPSTGARLCAALSVSSSPTSGEGHWRAQIPAQAAHL